MAGNNVLRTVSYGTARLQKRVLVKSCLLGLGVGDALGAAVEFMSSSEIKNKYGEAGIPDFQGTTIRYIACNTTRISIR